MVRYQFVQDEDVPADPFCDHNHPKTITFEDVSAASFRIASGIRKTPCSMSHMSKLFNMELYFKKEQMQVSKLTFTCISKSFGLGEDLSIIGVVLIGHSVVTLLSPF